MKKSVKSKLYQQGDVLVFTETAIPENCKRVAPEIRGIVLAEGEVTGHAHTIDTTSICEMWKNDKGTWLNAKAPVTIKHQEHKAVTLPKGKYRIGIVREIDPFAEEINKVRD